MLVAVISTAVLALAGLGTGAWLTFRPPPGPLPPPDVPWPTMASITVFPCSKTPVTEKCGDRVVTDAGKREIERAIRAMPEVTELPFESKAEAFKNFRETFTDNTALIAATTESDMPESFRGTASVTTGEVVRKIKALPEIANLYVFGTGFWSGKTDLGITLCPQGEKNGVGEIYFENREHAAQNLAWVMHMDRRKANLFSAAIPEAFHVRLDDPEATEQLEQEIGKLPGVEKIADDLS
jgi:cell division protein FtsX